MIEYDPKQEDIKFDDDHIEFEIPIDDDFSNLDFVTNYYFYKLVLLINNPVSWVYPNPFTTMKYSNRKFHLLYRKR